MVQPTEIEFVLNGLGLLEWADFFLNPRRLRGSDFLMRLMSWEYSANDQWEGNRCGA